MQLRRVDVSSPMCKASSIEAMIRESVKRGEPVRITGLGTLAMRIAKPSGTLCLTLTAAVAKGCGTATKRVHERDGTWHHATHFKPEHLSVERDVRHLARALGAPVEVWTAEGRRGDVIVKPAHVTTVHP